LYRKRWTILQYRIAINPEEFRMIQTASIAAMIGDLYTASVRYAAVVLMFASCAETHWVTFRAEGVPRTKDGKLDRAAL
jgi:hypothetical protein